MSVVRWATGVSTHTYGSRHLAIIIIVVVISEQREASSAPKEEPRTQPIPRTKFPRSRRRVPHPSPTPPHPNLRPPATVEPPQPPGRARSRGGGGETPAGGRRR